ncbi:MAG: C39 family peptidase [Parachlamydiaceae bacterium]|nr:C39 family peptidase [Parachlamydiaceae bacterium]
MKALVFCLFGMLMSIGSIEAHMMHQKAPIAGEWKEENLNPFDELMLSWNASRPAKGKFLFYLSVKTDAWSPWLLYASWSSEGQSSFLNSAPESSVKVFQDALEVLDGKQAIGFQIKVVAEEGASLKGINALHVYTNSDRSQEPQKLDSFATSIHLKVSGLSQMTVDHMRHKDLCSPTSVTAVTRYLKNDSTINPVDVAQKVWDSGFDIYGNWVFNVAQASAELGPEWNCWVERLNGFETICKQLAQGNPVVVSVKGPLSGSALPYAKGHLMVVTGYDFVNQKVLCMDPSFPTDQATEVSYDFSDFMQAWNRRGKVAYIFRKKS